MNEEPDQVVLEWTLDRRSKGLCISRTLIRKQALLWSKEMGNTETDFLASAGWCDRCIRRNGVFLRRNTSVCQKDPDMVIAKLVANILRIRRLRLEHNYAMNNIYAMDETPVWCDMVSTCMVDKTGSKHVTLKTKVYPNPEVLSIVHS